MAFDLGSIAAGVKILGGLKGLFGKKPKQITPRDNMMSQAQGARDAAAEYGFNPLTMLQYGQPGGALSSGGGAPPLASIDLLTDGLQGLDDVLSGDAARRRAADQLQIDMARLKLDQARSGVVLQRDNVTNATFATPSPIGRNNAVFAQSNVRSAPAPFSLSNPLAPGRQKEIAPVTNSPGVMEIDNALTKGPVTVPGDSEPWGLDELGTAVFVGLPQAARNWTRDLREQVRKASEDKKERDRQMKAAARSAPRGGGIVSALRYITGF